MNIELDGLPADVTAQQRAEHEARHLGWWLEREPRFGRALYAARVGSSAFALGALREIADEHIRDRVEELEDAG